MKLQTILIPFLGEVSQGHLGRGPFLWRFILVVVIFLTISIVLGLNGGIAKRAAFYIAVSGLLCFVVLNLMAKRFRDIGVSGWIWVCAVLGVGILLSVFVPGPVEIFYGLTAIVGLSVFPGKYRKQLRA